MSSVSNQSREEKTGRPPVSILREYFRVVDPKCCFARVFITSYAAQVGLILESSSAAFHHNIIFDISSCKREEEVAQKTLSLPDKE